LLQLSALGPALPAAASSSATSPDAAIKAQGVIWMGRDPVFFGLRFGSSSGDELELCDEAAPPGAARESQRACRINRPG